MSDDVVLDKHGWPVEQIRGRWFQNWLRRLIHGRLTITHAEWERRERREGRTMKLRACEICETTVRDAPLYGCDIGAVPRGGLYFCAEHYLQHLRDAHGYSGEQAALALARRKGESDAKGAKHGK